MESPLPPHGPAYGKLALPRATGALASLVVFLVLCTTVVGLLFFSRLTYRGRMFIYDWMVLAALVSVYRYHFLATGI